MCRTGAGEIDRALGLVHQEAVSPGAGHIQASLRMLISVGVLSPENVERQVCQTMGTGPQPGGTGSRGKPLE